MSNHTYGVVSRTGEYTDICTTERGIKQFATRRGYSKVYIRYNCGYHVVLVAEKINGKWSKV